VSCNSIEKIGIVIRSLRNIFGYLRPSPGGELKRLPHELFTFFPKRLSGVRVERISAHSVAYASDTHALGHDGADVAVRALSATDLVSGRNHTGPYRRCGSLGSGLSGPQPRGVRLRCPRRTQAARGSVPSRPPKESDVDTFLLPLPVSRLTGVGKETGEKLEKLWSVSG